MSIAVITPVRGREAHLLNQRRFLDEVAPDARHVIVAVDSPHLPQVLRRAGVFGPHVDVIDERADALGMPTARARNRGAEAALAHGADALVFLDVDCVPLPGFVEAVRDARRAAPAAVWNGIVTYLPEGVDLAHEVSTEAARLESPHPARPAPAPGEVTTDESHHLLWSLAFGLDAETWRAAGGFDERYVGYGAEDTDFGRRAAAVGASMAWVGGMRALHQWHPSGNPPVHHLADIVRNSTLYFERWGEWPMGGWLTSFADAGLVEWGATSLTLTDAGRRSIGR